MPIFWRVFIFLSFLNHKWVVNFEKKFCICCDYHMIFSFAILGYLSFYQMWVKRSRSYVHRAAHSYFKWCGLMNSKRMNMKFRRPKGDALGHNIWRAYTSLVNWVLIMPLVNLTKPEDGGWEAQDMLVVNVVKPVKQHRFVKTSGQ